MANANVDRHSARESTLTSILAAVTGIAGGTAITETDIQTAVENANTATTSVELSRILGAMTLGTGSVSLTSTTIADIQTAVENANTATTSAELTGIANELSDIYTELLQKYEAGQDIGLDSTTMDALATAIATLFHYPTDYPNATGHTDALAIETSLAAINAAITNGTQKAYLTNSAITVAGSVTVNNNPSDYPNATAHTDAVAVASALSAINAAITNGTQRALITNSAITVTGAVTVTNSSPPTDYPNATAHTDTLLVQASLITVHNDLAHLTDGTGVMVVPADSSHGYTAAKTVSAASTNATSLKGSAGTLGFIAVGNTNAAARYLKIYDKSTAPTVGTDTPVAVFIVPGNTSGAGSNLPLPPQGLKLSNGIAFAITTGMADTDTGAVGITEVSVAWGYK